MRIAIIGGGAAGLMTSWLLQPDHEVTLYEAAPFLGGHARTITVECEGVTVPCETGFKYFFAAYYPTLLALLSLLGVKARPRWLNMTLRLRDGSELVLPPRAPSHLLGLLASPRRLIDLVRYERLLRSGGELLARQDWSVSLQRHVEDNGYSQAWAEELVFPTLAANWGTSAAEMKDFPAYSVLKVLARYRGRGHRFLELDGGVSSYIARLVQSLDRVALRPGVGVARLELRGDRGILVEDSAGHAATFDQLVLATSSRDAARLLAHVPGAARWHDVLSRFRHFPTTIAIHGDPSFMPPRRHNWSVINVFHDADGAWQTEWSGRSHGAPVFRTWLRQGLPRPRALHHLQEFHHLLVTPANRDLQRRVAALQGHAGLWAVGMYATDVDNHESALASTLPVARALAPGSPSLARIAATLA